MSGLINSEQQKVNDEMIAQKFRDEIYKSLCVPSVLEKLPNNYSSFILDLVKAYEIHQRVIVEE